MGSRFFPSSVLPTPVILYEHHTRSLYGLTSASSFVFIPRTRLRFMMVIQSNVRVTIERVQWEELITKKKGAIIGLFHKRAGV